MKLKQVANHIAALLVLTIGTLPVCAKADDAAPLSFDQFIDSAAGQDVPLQGSYPAYAYRAKRVNKNLWTFINLQGYYITYRKKFDAWCASNGGASGHSSDVMSGVCVDQSDANKALAGYQVRLTTTASYDGQMTAGYATFYYTNQDGLAQEAADELQRHQDRDARLQAEAQARREAAQRNRQCYEAQQHMIQQTAKPGMETNLGMIVAVKPPLVFVQEHTSPPVTEWVRISELAPEAQANYCDSSSLN